jgi:NDP-sugar pyrophosphorylase family protein
MNSSNGTSNQLKSVPAIVLSGGEGTRIREVTHDSIPKALLRLGSETLIEHTLRMLRANAFEKAIIAVSHLSAQVRQHVGDGSRFSLSISYSETDSPNGVLHQCMAALSDGRVGAQHFLICGCDEVCPDLDLGAAFQLHLASGAILTICAIRNPERPYRNLQASIDAAGRVTALSRDSDFSEWSLTGIAFVRSSLLSQLSPQMAADKNEGFLLKAVLPKMISAGQLYAARSLSRSYTHISTTEAYYYAVNAASAAPA